MLALPQLKQIDATYVYKYILIRSIFQLIIAGLRGQQPYPNYVSIYLF